MIRTLKRWFRNPYTRNHALYTFPLAGVAVFSLPYLPQWFWIVTLLSGSAMYHCGEGWTEWWTHTANHTEAKGVIRQQSYHNYRIIEVVGAVICLLASQLSITKEQD